MPIAHSVRGRFLGAFLSVTLAIGVLHELRFVGEIAIVVVRFGKAEIRHLADVGERFWEEVTTWTHD
jgi:hypothetical protein